MKTFKIFLYVTLISFYLSTGLVLAEQDQKSKVAARVNDKEILMSDVDFFVDKTLERAKFAGQEIPPEIEDKIRKEWMAQLISRELLLQQAMAENVTVSEDDIEKGFSAAQQQGVAIPADKLRELIKTEMIVKKVVEAHVLPKSIVNEDEIKKFYETRKDEFKQPEQIRAKHILIKTNHTDTQDQKDKARKKIERILAEAKTDKEDFGELARKYSEGPSGQNGGDLGYFGRGQMVPAFEKAAFALKVGEISNVVETKFGYHIIKKES